MSGGVLPQFEQALGSATYVIKSTLVSDTLGPARIAGQIVTGAGFHRADLIMHQGAMVRGTTPQ